MFKIPASREGVTTFGALRRSGEKSHVDLKDPMLQQHRPSERLCKQIVKQAIHHLDYNDLKALAQHSKKQELTVSQFIAKYMLLTRGVMRTIVKDVHPDEWVVPATDKLLHKWNVPVIGRSLTNQNTRYVIPELRLVLAAAVLVVLYNR